MSKLVFVHFGICTPIKHNIMTTLGLLLTVILLINWSLDYVFNNKIANFQLDDAKTIPPEDFCMYHIYSQ